MSFFKEIWSILSPQGDLSGKMAFWSFLLCPRLEIWVISCKKEISVWFLSSFTFHIPFSKSLLGMNKKIVLAICKKYNFSNYVWVVLFYPETGEFYYISFCEYKNKKRESWWDFFIYFLHSCIFSGNIHFDRLWHRRLITLCIYKFSLRKLCIFHSVRSILFI